MYTRRVRASGETLTVARPIEIGADPEGGAWLVKCEDHGTLVYTATEAAAYRTHGIDFCESCREGGPAPTPKTEPAKKPAVKKAAAR